MSLNRPAILESVRAGSGLYALWIEKIIRFDTKRSEPKNGVRFIRNAVFSISVSSHTRVELTGIFIHFSFLFLDCILVLSGRMMYNNG